MELPLDKNSHANINEIVTQKFHLSLTADFSRRVLHGHIDLFMKATKDDLSRITLDSRDLHVSKAMLIPIGELLEFTMDKPHEAFGSALHVQLKWPLRKEDQITLRIFYETSPNASGLQWLPPSQTEGKKYPYLFSQFQAIHCRSALPCQDTPSIKSTYSADITVPLPLTALMSAISEGKDENSNENTVTFHFAQRVPIPSYLTAIVVGDLVSRDIGPRSKVWTEKETIDAAAYEFAETEDYLKTAEELLTPYEWGRYDLLILPSSFPYGGMENPCLTFVTPTLLAGDRSLSSVVAHEIAHSWMGNLVTNRGWEHFWMNEGFTVFIERKIIGRLQGEKMRHFRGLIGNKALKESVELFGADHQFTALIPDLSGVDPDDAFSSVPYERGFQFLFYLESLVGIEAFEDLLKAWVKQNAFGTVTSDEFREFFLSKFSSKSDKLSQIDWNAWFKKPGMPPVDVCALFDTSLANAASQLAQRWLNGGIDTSEKDLADWDSTRIVYFLQQIDTDAALPLETVKRLGALYKLNESRNSEIQLRWYLIAIKAEHEEVFLNVVNFLKSQGRMKFVRPLYRALFKCPKGTQLALDTFKQYRQNYHNIAQKMIAKDLGLSA